MIRSAIVLVLLVLPLWAPWMDAQGSGALAERVFAVFGPVPSACYDSAGNLLSEGVAVRWYPMGRVVHTCGGDYVVWFWGGVAELGGVYKRPGELALPASRPLTCIEVLERNLARRSSTTGQVLSVYSGTPAAVPDFSIFPQAREYQTAIAEALARGPNFAGKFAVAEWSCGTLCEGHAIVDVQTGLVIGIGPNTDYGVWYATTSTLFITNPIEKLPALPQSQYESETLALSIARVPREYYRLTRDELSGTEYLVRECLESSATGYIEVADDRLGVVQESRP